MPQKRNPYALVVIRGAAGTLLGRATGLLATQRTPSGRTDNLLYAYGELGGAIALATRTLALAAATAESLTIDRERAERAITDAALATDAAEILSLTTGLDYRSAYDRVGKNLDEHGALDPRDAIATRTTLGGAAPAPMDAMLADCTARVATTRDRLATRRAEVDAAERALLA
jgi:argininosuccinate lyase